jgi:DNA-directed RNA polymerase subunit RPC12/RpoP
MTTTMSDLAVAVARLQEARKMITAAHDAAAFEGQKVEFLSKLFDATNAMIVAQEERSALLERIRNLEKQNEQLKAWVAEKEKYELVALAPHVNALALKESMHKGEPPHYLCANCFDSGKKIGLHKREYGYDDKYICNSCNQELLVKARKPVQRSALPSRNRFGDSGG